MLKRLKTKSDLYYTVEEIVGAELKLHRDTIPRRFRDEPGELKLSNAGKRHVRIKTTLPDSCRCERSGFQKAGFLVETPVDVLVNQDAE